MTVSIVNKFSGEWELTRVKARSGTVKQRAKFPNLILNSGLDYLCDQAGSANVGQGILVGEGNSPPDPEQTELDSYVGRADGLSSPFFSRHINSPGPPYFGYSEVTRQFAPGAAAGNLTEIGLSNGLASSNNPLFSRSLILDNNGEPTSFTVLSDEILIAVHRCRQYVILEDVPGEVSIGGTLHEYVIRSAMANSNQNGISAALYPLSQVAQTGGATATAYTDQTLGPITGAPSGSIHSGAVTWALGPYTPGTYNRDITLTAGTGALNVAGGIGALRINTSRGCYQVSFSPKIPKSSENTLSLTFNFGVARL